MASSTASNKSGRMGLSRTVRVCLATIAPTPGFAPAGREGDEEAYRPGRGHGRDSVELVGQTAIPREASSGGNPGSNVPVVYGVVPTGQGAGHGACTPARPRSQSWFDGDAGCAHSCRTHHRALQTLALVAIRSNRAMNQKPLTAGPSPRRSA